MRNVWWLLAAAGLWVSMATAEPSHYQRVMDHLASGRCHEANLILIEFGDTLTDEELASVARTATAREGYCRRMGRTAMGVSVALTAASFLLPLPLTTLGIAATNVVGIPTYLHYGYQKLDAKGCKHQVAMARLRRRQPYDDR